MSAVGGQGTLESNCNPHHQLTTSSLYRKLLETMNRQSHLRDEELRNIAEVIKRERKEGEREPTVFHEQILLQWMISCTYSMTLEG